MKKYLPFIAILLILTLSALSISGPVLADTFDTTQYPPFPTATLTSPLPENDNVYLNNEFGFSLIIPDGIKAITAPNGSGYFQSYELGNAEGFGSIFSSAASKDETLKQVAERIFDSEIASYSNMVTIKNEEISLANGGTAWYIAGRGTDLQQGYTLEIRLTTYLHGGQAILLEFYSLPQNFIYWDSALDNLRDSLQFSPPTVYGYPRDQILILESGESSNPRENDPATTHGAGDYLIFEGLVTYHENLTIAPALAASWEVSPDGKVYTFHLQPDAVFHNGRPVTAADVVYSWERAANVTTASDTVMTYLNDIVGVKEMHSGESNSIGGLKIIDEHTLQVSIDAPKPYFLYKLTYPTANVLDRENVESGQYWYMTPNGTGPYRLTRWDTMLRKMYERFEGYYGEKPAITAVIENLYSGDEFRLYEEGAVDVAGVATYNVERVSDPSEPLNKELLTGVSLCTSYIQFDVSKPPFDDPKVRQAFTLAFDKQKYLSVVLKNTNVLAKGLYPPALPGYNLDLNGYGYDPERARQLIAESKYGSVEAFPEIVFTSGGYGNYSGSLVSAMSDMWRKNLGVTITIRNLDPQTYYDAEAKGDFGQLSTGGWCADYPDPQNFADVLFHTGAEMNSGNYSNPMLDDLLDQAAIEPDVTERIRLYQQAEQIIVDDAAAIFLYHGGSFVLVKPYVKGYSLTPISTYPLIRFMRIDPDYWN